MRVCVVDDHEIVREGLRMVLPNDPEFEIVAEAASAREALQALRRHLPDVLITDYRLPDMTGAELCARVRTDFPSTAVVVLTTYLSEDVVQRCTDAGAAGFVTKAAGLGELRRVLRLAAAGDRTPEMATGGTSALVKRLHEASAKPGGRKQLTPQQERVLELAARGMTYGAISHELHISESTVRFHIQGLKDRLGVRTKAELIATAVRSALIAPGVDAVDG